MARSRPLGVGLIGAGYFSRFHLEGWAGLTDARVLAVCDLDPARAHEAARAYGIEHVFTDPRAMIEAVGPDLIDIAAPPPAHRELVMLAQSAGLAAICQKPLAGGLSAARELLSSLPAGGPALVVHENFRFSPWYREIHRWIVSGRLGGLHGISFRLRPGDGQGADAYLARQPYFREMPLFLVHETAVHFVDTFRFLFGEVRRVAARLRRLNPGIAGEDAGIILFDFEGGGTGLFDGNRLNEHPALDLRRTMGECWVDAEAGVMRLDGDARLFFKPHGHAEHEVDYDRGPATFAGGACGALQAHVVSHLLHGTPLENAAADYLQNLKVVEAIYAASATGRFVSVEPPDALQ